MKKKLPARENRGYPLQSNQKGPVNTQATYSMDAGEFFLNVKAAGSWR